MQNEKFALKRQYLQKAIDEYEYSRAPEYQKRAMTARALSEGTVDLDYEDTDKVEISQDGGWVTARVWVPKSWL
jgi:hypothetical protein